MARARMQVLTMTPRHSPHRSWQDLSLLQLRVEIQVQHACVHIDSQRTESDQARRRRVEEP